MKKLLIFPFNGNGLEALDCLAGQYELLGFVDDEKSSEGKTPDGISIFSREAFLQFPEAQVLAVPGSPASYLKRTSIISSLHLPLERFATVVHPAARVSSQAKIGKNVLLMAGVVITSNAVIEDHVCILPNTVVHHDVIIGAYTLIGSGVGIAGSVKVESNCYIGSGSNFIHNITIGRESLIGLGSTVLRDVLPQSKVVGNPARPIPVKD